MFILENKSLKLINYVSTLRKQKQEQIKTKVNKRKEIIKVTADINEIEIKRKL